MRDSQYLQNEVNRLNSEVEELQGYVRGFAELKGLLTNAEADIRAKDKQIKTLKGLLRVAKCPECPGGGTKMVTIGMNDVGQRMGQPAQCQWCDVKAEALKEPK